MPTYIGFSTINATTPESPTNMAVGIADGTGSINTPVLIGKKFRLTDDNLVLQDFINALNIPQGQMPGRPQYGTTLWSFVFEPNTIEVQKEVENEIRRVVQNEPRLIVNTVSTYPQENGILIQLEIAITPNNQPQILNVILSRATNTASLVGSGQ